MRLVECLRSDGQVSVAELAGELRVTPSTIRRDLGLLARQGRVVRTYGGAALPAAGTTVAHGDPAREVKRRIAGAAADLVQDQATIAIGSGSTALELARQLVDRRLTVITNALDVANVLLDRPGIELIILGGVVRPGMHSILGHLAEIATRELRADTLFMGIGAISVDQGLMNDSVPEILIDRALRRMARTAVVLADASKFRQVEPGFVFGLGEVDVLVTDDAVPAPILEAVTKAGVRVIIAPGPASSAGDPSSAGHPSSAGGPPSAGGRS